MARRYVKVGGSDSASGIDHANAWATLNYAFTQLVSGDELYCCTDLVTALLITAFIDCTSLPLIRLVGCNNIDGTPYNGGSRALISTSVSINEFMRWMTNYTFLDLEFDGNGTQDIIEGSTGTGNFFVNCGFKNAGSAAVTFTTANTIGNTFINCDFHDNTFVGLQTNQTTYMYNCSFYDNPYAGIYCTEPRLHLIKSRFFRCGNGIEIQDSTTRAMINECIFAHNTESGIKFPGVDSIEMLINSIFYQNTEYGLESTGSFTPLYKIIDYNCFFGNGIAPISGGTPIPGNNNRNVDPKFKSTTPGSENWDTESDSELRGWGLGYVEGTP